MPKFFVPLAKSDAEAEEVYRSVVKFAEETTGWPIEKDRIYSLAYTHNGQRYNAVVGANEPRTGELVIAILKSTAYLICTPNRGVVEGMPILADPREAEAVLFE